MNDLHDLSDEDFVQIGRYLNNSLNSREKQEFERRLRDNRSFRSQVQQVVRLWSDAEPTEGKMEVDTDLALSRVMERVQDRTRAKKVTEKTRTSRPFILRIAAAILLLTLIGFGGWKAFYNVIEVKAGDGIVQHHLPDGSVVWLKPGAALKYSRGLPGNFREINLSGTAYFDVERIEEKPFVVLGFNSIVKVLGTEFEINSDSSETTVIVTEGVVELGLPDMDLKSVIKEGETATLNVAKRELSEKNSTTISPGSWATGRMIFQNAYLTDVIKEVNNYFDAEIRLSSPGIDSCAITTRFFEPELQEILEELSLLLSLKIDRRNDAIYLDGLGCNN